MSDIIRPSLLAGKRSWNFKALDNSLRRSDPKIIEQLHRGNLMFQAARVQFYVDKYIPSGAKEAFYDALQDYAQCHDLIAITEMRRAVKSNAFAPAANVRVEEADVAASISIGMAARYPDLPMKELIPKIEDERERVIGFEQRTVDRTTVHRHLKRVGESRRRRK